MNLVEFSLRKRITVSMIVIVIVIFGIISYFQLGLDILPKMEAPYISVVTTYSGVSSEDIEQSITRPLEQWVSTVSNVKELKSISQEGVSIIMVEFESGTNLDFAAQDIRDKIGLFENYLPEGAKKPLVVKFNFEDMPILMYGITAGNRDLKKLKDTLDKEVAARLERLDGVASAIIFSPEDKEVLIDVDKGKLEARGIAITQVEQALQASNINLPSGFMDENHKEYLLRTIGEFERIDEIGHIVVGAGLKGEPIFLNDLAEISETNRDIRNLVRINGMKGLMMIITKSYGANTVLVAREVKKTLEEIKPHLEKNLDFSIAMDFSRIIELMASRSAGNIFQGSILAMILIFLFLWNLRPTIAIGIAIPLSVITTFICMRLLGYTLNLITMGGLALGVGMMVDNAIVVIENIFRHIEEGKSPYDAARVGTIEVGFAISGSTLTTIAVFFPMMLATGLAGTFSRGLAVSISISLLASLFVAVTIIPMMASWFFNVGKGAKEKQLHIGENKFARVKSFYQKLLFRTLHNRKKIIWAVIGAFVLSILLAMTLGTEFLPVTDQAMIFLKLSLPVGTTLTESNRVIKYIENQSLKDPFVLNTMVTVGLSEQNAQDSASGFNPAGSYEATLWAYLNSSSQRNLKDKEIVEKWRQYFPELKNGKIQFIDVASASMGMSSASPIEFNVFGRDLSILKGIADRLQNEMENIKGLRDIKISLEESKPELRMRIKKEEASRLGLTTYDISRQVESFTIGTVVTRMMLDNEERDIRVRLSEKDRSSFDALKKLPIIASSGKKVYLSEIADFERTLGAVKIERENQVRKVSVTANYFERDLGSVVKDVMVKTRSITDNLPPGYFTQVSGAYKDMMETFATMLGAMLLALVLVYAVMASQFENLKHPFIIMFTIPLAFIGVSAALFITGKNINLPVFMGFIMLGGIVVNNGIIMVDYMNRLIDRGREKVEAVVEGAVTRLRPILITSLSTIFGMLPMAVIASEGSEMRAPMAITIIGGLTASTFLTLFIVPILYTYFSKIKIEK